VRVLLFAVARQLAGCEAAEVELAAGSTVGDLRRILAQRHPGLAAILPQTRFAVDAEYATDGMVLTEKSEVACIPPVSGG
jgi:molybdopterin synthase catalytic subunit